MHPADPSRRRVRIRRLARFCAAVALLAAALAALLLVRVTPLTTHAVTGDLNSSATTRPQPVDGFAALPALFHSETSGRRAAIVGASLLQAGLPGLAAPLLRQASQDDPERRSLRLALAEALVLARGGEVTAEAKALIDAALFADPNDVVARFYHALWLLRTGKPKPALVRWVGLMRTVGGDPVWYARLWAVMPLAAARTGVSPLALRALCVAGM